MAIEIAKGSVLRDVVPYAVVPLYGSNDGARHDGADGDRSRADADDPTRVAALERLPRWTPCRIWERRRIGSRDDRISNTPHMAKYWRNARRTAAASSSEDAAASWHVLCLLTLLRVVADKVCDESRETPPSTDDERPSGGDAPSQWWSPLVSERCDDDDEEGRKLHSDDDDDDDVGASLLVELWPLIRDFIPWHACLRLHRRIRTRLHILKVEHPLTTWARTTLFRLTDEEFRTGWNLVEGAGAAEEGLDECDAGAEHSSSPPPNRLAASKLLLDRVADLPARLVGVLIDDPLTSLAGGKTDVARGGGGEDENIEMISPALSLPRRHQSRLPNTCLELHVVANDARDVRGEQSMGEVRCRWIALYDLSSDEARERNRTLSTMPILRGRGRSTTPSSGEYVEGSEIDATNLARARRLAHSYFQRGEFRDAMSLYRRCFRFCASSNERREETDGRSLAESKGGRERDDRAEADLWHAMGAVLLSRGKFALAQRHWRDGGCRYRDVHEELAGQLEKQDAYRYFRPQPEVEIRKCSYEVIRPSKRRIARNPNDAAGPTVYLSSDVIEADVCDDLIRWAKEHASNHGGWTASRHYAVPTTDLPVHRVPKLLRWFSEWAPRRLLPLLEDQFGSADSHGRFYVHDAFLVRYEAAASSHFLPLHFDESTHSCVLALNEDFEGGGSYIYGLNRSVAPRTGGMVSFLGDRCLHGGNPVTRGVRYILAIFLFRDEDLSRTPPGEADESNPLLPTERNGGKRRDEAKQNESAFPKRPKKDIGLQSDGGGFSFSFF